MIQRPQLWLPDRLRQRREDERLLRGRGGVSRRWMPGYPCCCKEECDLFIDLFGRSDVGDDWSVSSGTWSISSNRLQSSNANAKILVAPTAQGIGSVSTAIIVDVFATGGADATLRVYTSSTDYVDFICDSGGSVTHVAINGGTPAATALGTSFGVRICHVSNETITVYSSLRTVYADAVGLPDSEHIGVGHGATAAGGFDSFQVGHHASVHSHCYECRSKTCNHCTGPSPVWYEVWFDGVVTNHDQGVFSCTNCGDLSNQVFILEDPNNYCAWRYDFDSWVGDLCPRWINLMWGHDSGVPGEPGDYFRVAMRMEGMSSNTSAEWRSEVFPNADAFNGVEPCIIGADWIALTPYSLAPENCDFSAVTVRVRSSTF